MELDQLRGRVYREKPTQAIDRGHLIDPIHPRGMRMATLAMAPKPRVLRRMWAFGATRPAGNGGWGRFFRGVIPENPTPTLRVCVVGFQKRGGPSGLAEQRHSRHGEAGRGLGAARPGRS